jgi:hypothetical protein
VLTSASGFVFEPKTISTQYTFPPGSLLIVVNGIARTKKKRTKRKNDSLDNNSMFNNNNNI